MGNRNTTFNKFCARDAREIREAFARGDTTTRELAETYGVHRTTIDAIVYGRSWAKAGGPTATRPLAGNLPNESWRKLPGFAAYSVSSLGRVRIDVARRNIWAGKELSTTVDDDGYVRCSISADGKKNRQDTVHRLVAAAFIGQIPLGLEVNHKNGDRKDNTPANLEIVTKLQNIKHSIEILGSTRKGVLNPAAKLDSAAVLKLRQMADTGMTYEKLGAHFGITTVAARLVAVGKTWGHIGGPRQAKRKSGRKTK